MYVTKSGRLTLSCEVTWSIGEGGLVTLTNNGTADKHKNMQHSGAQAPSGLPCPGNLYQLPPVPVSSALVWNRLLRFIGFWEMLVLCTQV